MSSAFLDGRVVLHAGDAREVLRGVKLAIEAQKFMEDRALPAHTVEAAE